MYISRSGNGAPRFIYQNLQNIKISKEKNNTSNHKGVTDRDYGSKTVAWNGPDFLLQIRVGMDICHETRNS